MLKHEDISPDLLGVKAEMWWPDDNSWYLVEINKVDLDTKQVSPPPLPRRLPICFQAPHLLSSQRCCCHSCHDLSAQRSWEHKRLGASGVMVGGPAVLSAT